MPNSNLRQRDKSVLTSSPSKLLRDAWDELYEHYYTDYPRETCGLILRDGTVLRFHNEATGTNEWSVSEVGMGIVQTPEIEAIGILAIYHSHVGGVNSTAVAIPSKADREFMAELDWPGVVHVILDPKGMGIWGYDGEVIEIGRLDVETINT